MNGVSSAEKDLKKTLLHTIFRKITVELSMPGRATREAC